MSKDMEDAGMGYDDDKTIANGDPDIFGLDHSLNELHDYN